MRRAPSLRALRAPLALAVPALALAACTGDGRRAQPACGIAAVASPTTLLTQFSVPRQTLSEAPRKLPERTVARLAAGPAYPALVGRADTMIVVGIEGTMPQGTRPRFGVLVIDPEERVRGVMLYEIMQVEAAPVIGSVTIGSGTAIPLLGLQLDPTRYEDPRCPVFPDSLSRP